MAYTETAPVAQASGRTSGEAAMSATLEGVEQAVTREGEDGGRHEHPVRHRIEHRTPARTAGPAREHAVGQIGSRRERNDDELLERPRRKREQRSEGKPQHRHHICRPEARFHLCPPRRADTFTAWTSIC